MYTNISNAIHQSDNINILCMRHKLLTQNVLIKVVTSYSYHNREGIRTDDMKNCNCLDTNKYLQRNKILL